MSQAAQNTGLASYYGVNAADGYSNSKSGNSLDPNLAHLQSQQFNLKNHIIICGLHNLGFRILEQLVEADIPVLVIDDDPDPRLVRRSQSLKIQIPLIPDDSRYNQVLIAAGIQQARAVIAVSDNDLHNLETVLSASEIRPGLRCVASFFNLEIGQRLKTAVPHAEVLDLSELAAPVFVNATTQSTVLHDFAIQKQPFAVVDIVPKKDTRESLDLEVEFLKHSLLGQTPGTSTFTPPALNVGNFAAAIPLLLRTPSRREKEAAFAVFNMQPNIERTVLPDVKSWVCPPLTQPINNGDHLSLLGTLNQLKSLNVVSQAEAAQIAENVSPHRHRHIDATNRSNIFSSSNRFLRGVLDDLERPFRITLVALVITIILSTFFFSVFHRDSNGNNDLNLLESLYFTVTIITTIGFGDISLLRQDWWVLIYGVVLEFIGAGSLAVLYAFVTNYVVSRRLEQSLGTQRATNMKNHIVVAGLDNLGIGYRVVQELAGRYPVIVVEKDEQNRFVQMVRELHATVIIGDSRQPKSLERANVKEASCIVIVSGDDTANIETALAARNLHAGLRVVLRLFERSLAEKIEQAFDIQIAHSTSAIAAPSFIAAALNYKVITSFYIGNRVFIVARLEINPNGELCYQSSNFIYHQHIQVRILAFFKASNKVFNRLEGSFEIPDGLDPMLNLPPDQPFQSNDTIYLVGPYDQIIKVHQLNSPQP